MPSEIRRIANRVGLRSGWFPLRRDRRVPAKKANTVAPISRAGFSARAAHVKSVKWLSADIACKLLKLVRLLLFDCRARGAKSARDDGRYQKRDCRPANHRRQNWHGLGLEEIEISDHADASRNEQHSEKLQHAIRQNAKIIRQFPTNGEFGIKQDQACDRGGKR